VTNVERSIYFYGVDVPDGHEWRRAQVLRDLAALTGDDQFFPLGDDNFAWAKVDHVPRSREGGRLRFFRDRRSNLPGYAHQGNVAALPIPDEAGIVEPTHVVLGGSGLIAAEYNHFAPRIPSHFGSLLRTNLNLDVRIGTYIQGSIVEQLDRLDYIRLLEVSLVPTPELEEELRNSGPFGEAAAQLMRTDGGRRVNLRLTAERDSQDWTEEVRSFVRRVLRLPGSHEHTAKVLRVTGYDPLAQGEAAVDLLKQRLVRQVDIERPSTRSKALDTSSAYDHIEHAIAEVRQTDLPNAALIF
jgi:hypothetical protein